jgi:hypothetical protein
MQSFTRPEEPPRFKAKVKSEKARISRHFASKDISANGTKPAFPSKWAEFKAEFAKAQHGKCGYCEMRVIGGQNGDVEHFYPKGEVWHLHPDPQRWGREKDWASTVVGRERIVFCDQGYWWLAYDWSNYLLSCAVCNEYWKLSYFPVGNDPRNRPPVKGKPENALLLNPFDKKENPTKHLRFDNLGQIKPKNGSVHGFETIRTCGLDRESLRFARMEKAMSSYFLLARLFKTDDAEEISQILCDFFKLGDDRFVHSGMVQSIFEDYSGMSWADLEKIIKKRPCPEITFSFAK